MKRLLIIAAAMLVPAVSCGKKETPPEPVAGSWYCNDMSCTFMFTEENELFFLIDLSETMSIEEDGAVIMTAADGSCIYQGNYDGINFSLSPAEGINLLEMTRTDGASESVYGEYTMNSGVMYQQLAGKYPGLEGGIGMIVAPDKLEAKLHICQYTQEDGKLIFSAEGASVFAETGEAVQYNYAVDGNILTLVSPAQNLVLSKIE
ncbi:MAG: hypothetical protein NC093_11120 [Alistipes sp.]|nr:hypothetical protein [Alistipes sp.]